MPNTGPELAKTTPVTIYGATVVIEPRFLDLPRTPVLVGVCPFCYKRRLCSGASRLALSMSVLDGQSGSNSDPHLVGEITGVEGQP